MVRGLNAKTNTNQERCLIYNVKIRFSHKFCLLHQIQFIKLWYDVIIEERERKGKPTMWKNPYNKKSTKQAI